MSFISQNDNCNRIAQRDINYFSIFSVNQKEEILTHTIANDSGLMIEDDLSIIETDDGVSQGDSGAQAEDGGHVDADGQFDAGGQDNVCGKTKSKSKCKQGRKKGYKKPARLCLFCNKPESRLKRHILKKHKNIPEIAELLKMESEEQDRHIDIYRKEAIKRHNIGQLDKGKSDFIRQRNSVSEETPVMCSGCKGFYAKGYKSRSVFITLYFDVSSS